MARDAISGGALGLANDPGAREREGEETGAIVFDVEGGVQRS